MLQDHQINTLSTLMGASNLRPLEKITGNKLNLGIMKIRKLKAKSKQKWPFSLI